MFYCVHSDLGILASGDTLDEVLDDLLSTENDEYLSDSMFELTFISGQQIEVEYRPASLQVKKGKTK